MRSASLGLSMVDVLPGAAFQARAVLVATWVLEDVNGSVLRERQSRFVRALADPGGTTAALELSRALAELSEEIADALNASADGARL